jgi:hypothetical protein
VNGYNFALVLHIAGVIAMFCGAALVLTSMGGARRARSVEAYREWTRMGVAAARLTSLFSLLLFFPAAYMVGDRWSWGSAWVDGALVGLIVANALLGAIVTPGLRMLTQAAEEAAGGDVSRELRRDALAPALWLGGQLFTTITSGVVVLMVYKPDVAGSILVMVVATLLGLMATVPAAARRRAHARLNEG